VKCRARYLDADGAAARLTVPSAEAAHLGAIASHSTQEPAGRPLTHAMSDAHRRSGLRRSGVGGASSASCDFFAHVAKITPSVADGLQERSRVTGRSFAGTRPTCSRSAPARRINRRLESAMPNTNRNSETHNTVHLRNDCFRRCTRSRRAGASQRGA
jgi:hypothetical protein